MSKPTWILAALAALAVLLSPANAHASPAPGPTVGAEGGTAELTGQLDAANRAYVDAQNALTASQERQAALADRLKELEPRYTQLRNETQRISVAAYQNGGNMRSAESLLSSGSPGVFADRVTTLEIIARSNAGQLREVSVLREELTRTKGAIDSEVTGQLAQLLVMAKQRAAVEAALADAQHAFDVSTTWSGKAPTTAAQPAPHDRNGAWPVETCSMSDPTTDGCLTPRTLHALEQVRQAGFTHYVSCWRPPGQPFEHPKGRACDFAAERDGFGGVAEGVAKEYGTQLATWLVRNAKALGLMYVIWYQQIWTPAAGWHAYLSGKGDPASDHTNHVHMSVY